MLNNYDVDMLLFSYFENPNIVSTINKSCYKIYMDNDYWQLRIYKINKNIPVPCEYKYCKKNFYFKTNTGGESCKLCNQK